MRHVEVAGGRHCDVHTIIENQYALNTHRIESIDELNGMRSFTTKDDNNDVADTHIISDGDIVGQYVFKFPGMGKVMDFLSSTWGFLIVIVLPMLLFFIYQVYHLVIVGMNLKRAMGGTERIPYMGASALVDDTLPTVGNVVGGAAAGEGAPVAGVAAGGVLTGSASLALDGEGVADAAAAMAKATVEAKTLAEEREIA